MKIRFLILSILFLIFGCSSLQKNNVEEIKYETCYSSYSPVFNNGKRRNIITLCIGNDSAQIDVFYPNDGMEPTICRQNGKIVKDGESIKLLMEKGKCENGRNLSGTWSSMECKYIGVDNITCIKENDGYIFVKKFQRPYGNYNF